MKCTALRWFEAEAGGGIRPFTRIAKGREKVKGSFEIR